MKQLATGNPFHDFDAEAYIVRRLKEHGKQVFAGVTNPTIRKERIRTAIIEGKMDCAVIGKSQTGKSETYRQLFERHFREPLYLQNHNSSAA